eukprot:TRINITY_DN5713_c0_g1_i1.p1 TRINITY_DN5713_c0_g1~~TRINITY_DN5713_c0_g1_i1.p1  ORF type:complete len:351 (+),score=55.40 TRINITY_DN5713_c0_g1_i1:909-1961(+)
MNRNRISANSAEVKTEIEAPTAAHLLDSHPNSCVSILIIVGARQLSPIRTADNKYDSKETIKELETITETSDQSKTTNIQSQYVIINNYNNYPCTAPFAMYAPPNAAFFQQPPCFPYYYVPGYSVPLVPSPAFGGYNPRPAAESGREPDIEKLLNNIGDAIKDQGSCRYLQKRLDEGDKEFTSRIFSKLIPAIKTHMSDPFGNYLCQKLFDRCSQSQLSMVIDEISEHVVELATNLHGTRAIQKVIENSVKDSELLLKIITILKSHVAEMVTDNNGNHVLQLCLTSIKSPHNDFIYAEIAASCFKVATHKHGCCVLQKCIDYATKKQRVVLSVRVGEADCGDCWTHAGAG